jgi:hypothetical protein
LTLLVFRKKSISESDSFADVWSEPFSSSSHM